MSNITILNEERESVFDALKSKDKKIRYDALDNILKLSRSNNTSWKKEFLNSVLLKSNSTDWEERYVAMYAISRFMKKNWDFQEFKCQFLNVLQLIEDMDGRVRIAARNALEHLRTNLLFYSWGEWKVDSYEIIPLWKNALFLLGEKAILMNNGKMQAHLVQCVKTLFQNDLEESLNKSDHKRYEELWRKICELDEYYYEYGIE
jgi:hypothetical protein